jgi:hypothetical protein
MGAKTSKSLRQQIGSFFHGMTGWMTAAAALIVAVVGALTALNVIPHNSAAHPAVSAAKWAAQANKICGQYYDAVDALPQPSSFFSQQGAGQAPSSSDLTDAARYSRAADRLGHQMLRQLTALKVPKGKEQQVTQFVHLLAAENTGLDTLTDDLTVLAAAFKSGNTGIDVMRMYGDAQQLSQLNKKFKQVAVDLGATTCAEGSAPNVFGSG